MSRAARILWVCAVTSTLCFIALVVVSKPELEPAELRMFDSRFFGYSVTEAVAYLKEIAKVPEAEALYLGTFRIIDTVFPILLTISLAGFLWLNTARLGVGIRILLLLAPLGYFAADMSENALVAQMLRAGPSVAAQTIEWASRFTQAKWALLALAFGLLLWAWWTRAKDNEERP